MTVAFDIVPLRDEHLPLAAELFAAGYRALRHRVPSMPPRHDHAASILPKLQALAAKTPGAVAIRKTQVEGFMMGEVFPSFRGRRTIYCPEWAHAAVAQGRRDIYRAMYAHVARSWIADQCLAHLITVIADQHDVLDAFFWLGFGAIGMDAMRDLTPVTDGAPAPDIEIRQARPDDVDAVLRLAHELEDHLAAPPVCKGDIVRTTRPVIQKRFDDPAHTLWLACLDQAPVACIDVQSPKSAALYVIADETTANITKAVTHAPYRHRGVATTLLNHILRWAHSQGYQRCAVGFETQNIPASRFWLKHFQPVACSMIRHIDEPAAGAS